jgi:hypothetical protein
VAVEVGVAVDPRVAVDVAIGVVVAVAAIVVDVRVVVAVATRVAVAVGERMVAVGEATVGVAVGVVAVALGIAVGTQPQSAPVPSSHSRAIAAQVSSHSFSQQAGRKLQTQVWHELPSQPEPACAAQQSPPGFAVGLDVGVRVGVGAQPQLS